MKGKAGTRKRPLEKSMFVKSPDPIMNEVGTEKLDRSCKNLCS